MNTRSLLGALALVVSLDAHAQVEQLYGTWKLVSFTRNVVATGESANIFGTAPTGFISYGRDGRFSAIIVGDSRPKPADLSKLTDQERAELFKTLIAYAGTFTTDGTRVVHHVDVSWNENWTGTAQPRNVKLEGKRLTISVDPQKGVDGKLITSVLIWTKVE